MTAFAERLPVTFVPEQSRITTMWDNMVNHSGRRGFSFLQAQAAKRMSIQKSLAG